MTVGVNVLHVTVIRPLVADVKGGRDGAAVGVVAVVAEDVLVQALVQVADGVVERQHDNLNRFFNFFEFYNVKFKFKTFNLYFKI